VRRTDIQIRDPFVVPVAAEQRYYLYGTTAWSTDPPTPGFDCYTSHDLEEWEGPVPAFRPEAGFWGTQDFWAPEVHPYHGRYFMFASFKGPDTCRGTAVLTANQLAGPFVPQSPVAVTPANWECLDGTLFVDQDQVPWMVFCHEWVQVRDGEICALRLSPDLRSAVGAPILLFRATEARWVVEIENRGRRGYVTDGPFLHRTPNGDLLMLWSSFGQGGYAIGVARSRSGLITGPWEQASEPLYDADGGHAMLFRTFDRQLMAAFHRPNRRPNERAQFAPLRENEGGLAWV
jgi:arabinan endo-1,5-alpha-L-arabinosidase